jgi:deoxyribodipyrimidine photolyase-related protein
MRNLVLVLGDQLDPGSAAFDGFDPKQDAVWMAEVDGECKHVWSHKARIVMFLAAMRHFAEELRARKINVRYTPITDPENRHTFAGELKRAVEELKPHKLIVVEPGEYRVKVDLEQAAGELGIPLDIRPDRHFLYSSTDFAEHAQGRKTLRLEYFYREVRKHHGILMDGSKPATGRWNYDAENRKSFDRKKGPGLIPAPRSFSPDDITRQVIRDVETRFAEHPGKLLHFDFPVTAAQALEALDDFIENRLARFGDVQDAMWEDQPYLFHSRLSAAMNLKLLDPRIVLRKVESAWRDGLVDISGAEGFIRQIAGWREYVRGVYWAFMPEYLERNALDATQPLPGFYWDANTEMNCLKHAIGQTLDYGYAHHIQRLMVTGLYSLLLGVHPKEIHAWYLAVYFDAVEWVELPNTTGMSQYADGGVMGSKPYVASGKYIDRMSNYCRGCRYNPNEATGDNACPFTTLYWDFLMRHSDKLVQIERMRYQLRNLDPMSSARKRDIRAQADRIRAGEIK